MTNRLETTVILDVQDFDAHMVAQCLDGLSTHPAIAVSSGDGQETFDLPANVARLHLSDARVKNRAQRLNIAAGAATTSLISIMDGPARVTDRIVDYSKSPIDLGDSWANVAVLPFVDAAPTREDFAVQDPSGPAFTTRPRMSRGRLITLSFDQWNAVRGVDESSTVPNDCESELLYRLTWLGNAIKFLEPRPAPLFSLDVHDSTPENARFCPPTDAIAIRQTRATVEKNRHPIRNIDSWTYPNDPDRPLISVVISTYNRADYISDSINSVLGQTFRGFEVIVVDDGSEDNTVEVVRSYSDPRIRVVQQENQGIAAARNAAAQISRGFFTAVHDDDDIMLPRRLAMSLSAVDDMHHATYGSWVNFDNESGAMVLHTTKQEFVHGTVFTNGQSPGHATWLIPTKYVRSLGYDESLSSAVDHNLSIRAMRSGLKWKHVGHILFIRRIHPAQVSITDVSRQKFAAHLTRFAIQVPASYEGIADLKEESKAIKWPGIVEKSDLIGHLAQYLPDHLVYRTMRVTSAVATKALQLNKLAETGYVLGELDPATGRQVETGELLDVRLSDFPVLSEHGITGTIDATLRADMLANENAEGFMQDEDPWNETYAFSRAISDRAPSLLKSFTLKGQVPALLVVPKEAKLDATGAAITREWAILYGRSSVSLYAVLGYSDSGLATRRLSDLPKTERDRSFLVAGTSVMDYAEQIGTKP